MPDKWVSYVMYTIYDVENCFSFFSFLLYTCKIFELICVTIRASVPQEYPFFAAWYILISLKLKYNTGQHINQLCDLFSRDLAFHTIPLVMVDPEFAKRQLDLLTREWYMHPSGQIPGMRSQFFFFFKKKESNRLNEKSYVFQCH